MSTSAENGAHHRDSHLMTGLQFSRSWDGHEFVSEARCLACQHYNLRCIIEQRSEGCTQCPTGRKCIFRRTVVVEAVPSAFSWPDLISGQQVSRKRPFEAIEGGEENLIRSLPIANGVRSVSRRHRASRHYRNALELKWKSKRPHDWKAHLRASIRRSERQLDSIPAKRINRRDNDDASSFYNKPVAPTFGASDFDIENIVNNTKLFPQTNTIAADDDDFRAAASFIDDVVEEFHEDVQDEAPTSASSVGLTLHTGPEFPNMNLDHARSMDMAAEVLSPQEMVNEGPSPLVQQQPASYSEMPYGGPGQQTFQNMGGPLQYLYPNVAAEMGNASMSTDLVASLTCPECDFRAKTMSEMKKHQARHQRAHICPVIGCPRQDTGFATINDLERHMRSVHKKLTRRSKDYKCFAAGCGKPDKIWPRLDNFKQHLIRMHPGQDVDELVRKSEQWWETEHAEDESTPPAIQNSYVNTMQNTPNLVRQDSSTLPSPVILSCNDLQFPSTSDPRALEEHMANCPSCSANRPVTAEIQPVSPLVNPTVAPSWQYPPRTLTSENRRWSTIAHDQNHIEPPPPPPIPTRSQSVAYPPPPQWPSSRAAPTLLPKPRPNGYVPTGLGAILESGISAFPNLTAPRRTPLASPQETEPSRRVERVQACRRCAHNNYQCSANNKDNLCSNCAARNIDFFHTKLLCHRGRLGDFLPQLLPGFNALSPKLEIASKLPGLPPAYIFETLKTEVDQYAHRIGAGYLEQRQQLVKNWDVYTIAVIPLLEDFARSRMTAQSYHAANRRFDGPLELLVHILDTRNYQSLFTGKPQDIRAKEGILQQLAGQFFTLLDTCLFDRSMYRPTFNDPEILWLRFSLILVLFLGIRSMSLLLFHILAYREPLQILTFHEDLMSGIYATVEELLVQELNYSVNYLNLSAAADRLGDEHPWHRTCQTFLNSPILSKVWKGQEGRRAWETLFNGGPEVKEEAEEIANHSVEPDEQHEEPHANGHVEPKQPQQMPEEEDEDTVVVEIQPVNATKRRGSKDKVMTNHDETLGRSDRHRSTRESRDTYRAGAGRKRSAREMST